MVLRKGEGGFRRSHDPLARGIPDIFIPRGCIRCGYLTSRARDENSGMTTGGGGILLRAFRRKLQDESHSMMWWEYKLDGCPMIRTSHFREFVMRLSAV